MSEGALTSFDVVRGALRRLDDRLRRAVELVRGDGAPPGADPYLGLVIREDEVDRLLARRPAEPLLWSADEDGPDAPRGALPPGHPARLLREHFALSDFELDVVLLALAPEVDLRYERLYAWLHDDLTRRSPSVSLALDLLCAGARERAQRLRCFDADAPLLRHGLVRLERASTTSSSRLSRALILDPLLVGWMSGRAQPERTVPWCRWVTPRFTLSDTSRLPLPAEALACAERATTQARVRISIRGRRGNGASLLAEAVAGSLGRSLLIADLRRAADDERPAAVLRLALCAAVRDAVLLLEGAEERAASEVPAEAPAPIVLAGDMAPGRRTDEHEWVTVELTPPDERARDRWWRSCLTDLSSVEPAPQLVETLAGRFRLDLDQIEAAAVTVTHHPSHGPVGAEQLAARCMAAARAVSGRQLARLGVRIDAVRTWEDIVLPPETFDQLRELCDRVKVRRRVVERWGFGVRLSAGLGCNALLAGPPGTGKTLAAEIIASELGLNLFRIDLAAVVSKYIGETEKNIGVIFDAAEHSNAVLLFDEAEALFGKRSEVRDSHDRYANIEVAYLLQRMERYEGVALLATNLAQHLDAAFVRRLAFTIHFPFPNADLRRRIWEGIWPAAVPLAADIDADWLARRFKLAGGHIKNAALAAAHLAAAREEAVSMSHLRHAIRREYQKLGKRLSDEELGTTTHPQAPVQIAGAR